MSNTSNEFLGQSLYIKLIKALLEARETKDDFARFTASQGEHVPEWERMVIAWEADHSQPDPYVVIKSGMLFVLAHDLILDQF